MKLHTVALLLLALSPLLISCADDIAYFSENGHYYQWIPLANPITYDAAKTLASSKSHLKQTGYIVTIGTATEEAFLGNYLNTITTPNTTTDFPTIWAGASRTGNSWVWNAAGRVSNAFYDSSTSTCYAYCNWNSTLVSTFVSTLTCAQIFLNNVNGPTAGTWRPISCSAVSPALVVEYDASTTCMSGYVYRTSKGWCEDVDECANNPKICGTGYKCVNTIGAYRCDDIDECAMNATICGKGFQCVNGNGSYSCVDLDECSQVPSVCLKGYQCQNLVGSYSCSDINECTANSSLCTKGYVCQNTPGSYQCNDIDECQLQNPCPFGTKCINTVGSYTCDSRYYQIQSVYNSLVLDFIVASDGINRVITNYISNSTSQLWSFTPEGFIINGKNGYVADAEGGNVYPGIKCILWPRKRIEQAGNQLWDYDQTSKLWTSSSSNVVLDIFHAQYAAGAEICLFPPKTSGDTPQGNVNQQWTLIESDVKP